MFNLKQWLAVIAQRAYGLPIIVTFPILILYGLDWGWYAASFLSPSIILTPVWLLMAKKTDVITEHKGQRSIQRYRLPGWLAWAETPDEHLPGGLYEPTHAKIYNTFGWFIASWYWLVRNSAHGIPWSQGVKAIGYNQNTDEIHKRIIPLWKFKLIIGFTVKKDNYSVYTGFGFWAVPTISLRWGDQD